MNSARPNPERTLGPSPAVALLLDGQGFMLEAEGDTQVLFGHAREALAGRHVSLVLPDMGDVALIENGQLNARLHFLCHVGGKFRITPKGHEQGVRPSWGYLSLVDLSSANRPRVRLLVRQADGADRVDDA